MAGDPALASDAGLYRSLWEKPRLDFLLRDSQIPIYEDMKAKLWGSGGYRAPSGPERRYILKCHRRWGKSFGVGAIAVELALTLANSRTYWAAETGRQVEKQILPNFRVLLETCPNDLRPVWHKADGLWHFPTTGSEIHIAGCEDEMKADRLRGDGADLFVIDEAGSIDPLRYVYRSIALWMVADRGGRIIMPSSPARRYDHPFTEYSRLAAAGDGGYARRTVYDSKWPDALIEELAEECGGTETAAWKREALAEDVIDEEIVLLPAFDPDVHVASEPIERPEWALCYTVGDAGWYPDFFAILWGWVDYERAKLVVKADWLGHNAGTKELADVWHAGEEEHFHGIKRWDGSEILQQWGPPPPPADGVFRPDKPGPVVGKHRPFARILDGEPRLRSDLSREDGISFAPANNVDPDAQFHKLNRDFADMKIEIDPAATAVIAHTQAAHRGRNGKLARSDVHGHYDAMRALAYFSVMAVRHVDPRPPAWKLDPNLAVPPALKRLQGSQATRALNEVVKPRTWSPNRGKKLSRFVR